MNPHAINSNLYQPIINKVVYNMLHNRTCKDLPRHRQVYLAFDEFDVESINKDLIAAHGYTEPPQRCLIFLLKFYILNECQIIGNITYFNDTDRFKIALRIQRYIDDLFKMGLNVIGTMSSGKKSTLQIIRKLDWEVREPGSIRHSVGRHKGIIHMFDPSWLMRHLLDLFKFKDITFKVAGQTKHASFKDILATFKHSERNYKLMYDLKKKSTTQIASKVFSTSVAKMLEDNSETSAKDTSDFCKFFDTLYDTLNGPLIPKRSKAFPDILTCNSLHHPFWLYAKCILSTMEFRKYSVTKPLSKLVKNNETLDQQKAINLKKELVEYLKIDTKIQLRKLTDKMEEKEETKYNKLISSNIESSNNHDKLDENVDMFDDEEDEENIRTDIESILHFLDYVSLEDKHSNNTFKTDKEDLIENNVTITKNIKKTSQDKCCSLGNEKEKLMTEISETPLEKAVHQSNLCTNQDNVSRVESKAEEKLVPPKRGKRKNKKRKCKKLPNIDSEEAYDNKDETQFKFNNPIKNEQDSEKICEYFIYNVKTLLTATLEITHNKKIINKLQSFLDILNCLLKEPSRKLETIQPEYFEIIYTSIKNILKEAQKIRNGEIFSVDKTVEAIDNLASFFMNKKLYLPSFDASKLKTLSDLDIFSAFLITVCGYDAMIEQLYDQNIAYIPTIDLNMDQMYSMVNKVQRKNKIITNPLTNDSLTCNMIDEEMAYYAFSIECNDTVR